MKLSAKEYLPAPTPCPECGGECVHAANQTSYGTLTVRPFFDQPRFLLGKRNSLLRAVVCTACGYTRFYAKEPERLRGGQ
jgi:hypothetical protein